MRLELEDEVFVNPAYKTLFYGLKKNHPHNVAVIQPFMFLLRRVLYTFVLIYMANESYMIYGVILLLMTCFANLLFITLETPWQEKIINQQHFVNEVIFYLVCVALMCFAGILTSEGPQTALGWTLVALVACMIIYNIVVILYDMWQFVRLYARLILVKVMKRLGWRNKSRSKRAKLSERP